jgi:small subunit ribosomal protein S4
MPMHQPRLRTIRRLGVQLPGLTRKSADRRPNPPGAHGASAGRRRPTDYRLRLEEKQKVRANYGVSERQLRRCFAAAQAAPGHTGDNLFALLERRLDNVAFRLGLAPTIPAARQLISHGHVAVGGAAVDRAGYLVSIGDRVELSARGRRSASLVTIAEADPVLRVPGWLERRPEAFGGRVIGQPARSDVPFPVDEALLVEFYAR